MDHAFFILSLSYHSTWDIVLTNKCITEKNDVSPLRMGSMWNISNVGSSARYLETVNHCQLISNFAGKFQLQVTGFNVFINKVFISNIFINSVYVNLMKNTLLFSPFYC